jgi:hypothetical protein
MVIGAFPAQSANSVTIHYVGLFKVETSSRGKRVDDIGDFKSINRTDQVPGRVGITFGIYYTVNGEHEGRRIRFREVYRYPKPGMRIGKKRHLSEEIKVKGKIGEPQFTGFGFDEEEEILEGIWTIEVWFDGELLASQNFNIHIPSAQAQVELDIDGEIKAICNSREVTGTRVPLQVCKTPAITQ